VAPSTSLPADLLPGQPGQLLGGVRGEGQAEFPALVGVAEHRFGVIGADDHQLGGADGVHDACHRDVAGQRHRPRVERRDLGHVEIGGAHKPGGVLGVGDQHVGAVDTGGLQPLAVVGEIHPRRADQYRAAAEHTDGVRHVARDPAAVHHQVVDQETQRHLLQMFGQQLLGKPSGETHQMVGGDRSGHRDGHCAPPFVGWVECALACVQQPTI